MNGKSSFSSIHLCFWSPSCLSPLTESLTQVWSSEVKIALQSATLTVTHNSNSVFKTAQTRMNTPLPHYRLLLSELNIYWADWKTLLKNYQLSVYFLHSCLKNQSFFFSLYIRIGWNFNLGYVTATNCITAILLSL